MGAAVEILGVLSNNAPAAQPYRAVLELDSVVALRVRRSARIGDAKTVNIRRVWSTTVYRMLINWILEFQNV